MQTHTEPLLLSVRDAVRLSGLSRSEIYRRLGSNEIQARKLGRSTLIEAQGLRALVDSLPRATFRSAEQRARNLIAASATRPLPDQEMAGSVIEITDACQRT